MEPNQCATYRRYVLLLLEVIVVVNHAKGDAMLPIHFGTHDDAFSNPETAKDAHVEERDLPRTLSAPD